MRAELVVQTLKDLWSIKRATILTGPPGGGKTTIVEQVAELLGVRFIHKHIPTMLVEDFGIPFPSADSNTFDYRLPEWFPREATDPDFEGILCFDDRSQASADLQKVIANIQQARELRIMFRLAKQGIFHRSSLVVSFFILLCPRSKGSLNAVRIGLDTESFVQIKWAD